MSRICVLSVLAVAAISALLLSACFETTVEDNTEFPRTISVSGTGEVRATPDLAVVRTGVEVIAPTVAEARAGAAEAVSAVVDAFLEGGVEELDILTVNFSIYPIYDYRDETPRISEYNVSNRVEVIVRDIESVGDLIDAVAAAGGDAVRFDGISFSYEDPSAFADEARERAIDDARAKAEQLAGQTGVTLGNPVNIVEASYGPPIVAPYGEFAFDAASSAPVTGIEPGTSSVSVTVQVTWAIE